VQSSIWSKAAFPKGAVLRHNPLTITIYAEAGKGLPDCVESIAAAVSPRGHSAMR